MECGSRRCGHAGFEWGREERVRKLVDGKESRNRVGRTGRDSRVDPSHNPTAGIGSGDETRARGREGGREGVIDEREGENERLTYTHAFLRWVLLDRLGSACWAPRLGKCLPGTQTRKVPAGHPDSESACRALRLGKCLPITPRQTRKVPAGHSKTDSESAFRAHAQGNLRVHRHVSSHFLKYWK